MAEIQETPFFSPCFNSSPGQEVKRRQAVVQKGHAYELTLLGMIIAEKMPPFLDYLDVLDRISITGQKDLKGTLFFTQKDF